MPLARSVYCAIQNREDTKIQIRCFLPESMGGHRDWVGEVSTLYTKKGPPRSLAVLRQTFAAEEDQWMLRVLAAMLGLRRTRQLNTPKHGFSMVIWSRLPNESGFGQRVAFGTAVSLALKAGTGLAKKRVDGVHVARAVVNGVREVLNERLHLSDALVSCLGRRNCALFVEHGLDPIMQWIPLPGQSSIAGAHLGVETPTTFEGRIAIPTGAAMGLAHLNEALIKEKEEPVPSWGKVTPSEFEDGLRSHVPTEQKGRDWLAKFGSRAEYEILAADVEGDRSYRLRALSEHQVRECARVRRFVNNLSEYGRTLREGFLVEAGRCLRSSHRSLLEKCSVKTENVNRFLKALDGAGREEGLFGGRVSEAGSCGVVTVLTHQAAFPMLRKLVEGHQLPEDGTGLVLTNTEDGGVLSGWWEGVLEPKSSQSDESAKPEEGAPVKPGL